MTKERQYSDKENMTLQIDCRKRLYWGIYNDIAEDLAAQGRKISPVAVKKGRERKDPVIIESFCRHVLERQQKYEKDIQQADERLHQLKRQLQGGQDA